MNLVDANVLLYAVNEDDPKHDRSRRWLDVATQPFDRDFQRFHGVRVVEPALG